MDDKYMDLIAEENKEAYLWYIGNDKSNKNIPFGSHQPILIHLLNTITEGDVMEFGVGIHSTPIMHTICAQQGRKLLSIDNDKEWFNPNEKYRTKDHEMNLFDNDKLLRCEYDFFNRNFAIIFVDAAPGPLRQFLIEKMKGHADYMIVHDTEEAIHPGFHKGHDVYNYDFSSFKHVLHFEKIMPATSVISDLDEIDKNILEIFKLENYEKIRKHSNARC